MFALTWLPSSSELLLCFVIVQTTEMHAHGVGTFALNFIDDDALSIVVSDDGCWRLWVTQLFQYFSNVDSFSGIDIKGFYLSFGSR